MSFFHHSDFVIRHYPAFRRAVGAGILLPIACLLTLVVTNGCGPGGIERAVISGTVTHNGQPLEEGEIRFIPERGSGVPMSGANIVDGKYVADAHGGVPVAKHEVQIESWRISEQWLKQHGPSGRDEVPDWRIPRQQIIPEKYNVRTELEIIVEPGSREITRDFELID